MDNLSPEDFKASTDRWDFDRKHACGDDHEWQPVGIEFARTYGTTGMCWVVCLKCGAHSCIETWWVGFKLANVFDRLNDTEEVN